MVTFPWEGGDCVFATISFSANAFLFTMSRSSSNTIDWRCSTSKEIVLAHLRNGSLPLTAEEMGPAEAWQYYQNHPVFVAEGVQYEQFRTQLNAHRHQVRERVQRAQWDAAAMEHDRLRHPYPQRNHRGELNFHLSPAQDLLRQDICNGRHLGMYPSDFRMTRPEYQGFSKKKFKGLVYQTVRHVKF